MLTSVSSTIIIMAQAKKRTCNQNKQVNIETTPIFQSIHCLGCIKSKQRKGQINGNRENSPKFKHELKGMSLL